MRNGIFILMSVWATATFAQSSTLENKLLRVGGMYTVKKIEKKLDRYFAISFEAKPHTGKFDRILLEADHVHYALKEGETLRISAEILKDKGSEAEASQILVFLPSQQGPTPVWILSRHAHGLDARASKYLDMHVPQTDYRIF